ncbi:MAG: riboflavin synthase [Rhodospirillaceae bacterium]
MFTGIITHIGRVQRIEAAGDTRLEIAVPFATDDLAIGASVACSGACMTVVEKGADWFAVSVSGESLSKTTMGDWREGTAINLERALKAGDELGGHIVSGHVDGVGTQRAVTPEGDSQRMTFEAPAELLRFIAPKGSITVDGVSLTVNEVADPTFGVNVITHTREATTLGALRPGDAVNLEIDMLARYVARLQDVNS